MNPIIVGVLTKESLYLAQELLALPPVRVFTNPLLYLTTPKELVEPDFLSAVRAGTPQQVIAHPKIFKIVFNQSLGYSTLSAGCHTGVGRHDLASYRMDQFHIEQASLQKSFVPYFDLMPDPMQNGSARTFSQVLMDAFSRYVFTFDLMVAEPSDEDHAFLFKRFNYDAAPVFSPMYGLM